MINQWQKQIIRILVIFCEKLSETLTKKNQKIKFLILVVLLKRMITILKSLKQKESPDISNLATKTALNTVENKITNVANLATKIALTTFENKIPNINNLGTKTTLTTVENKIPNVNSLF